jgi:hypothetical protein
MTKRVVAFIMGVLSLGTVALPAFSETPYLVGDSHCVVGTPESNCILLFDPEIPVPFDPNKPSDLESDTPQTGGFNPVPTKISITTPDLLIGVERRPYLSTLSVISPCATHYYTYTGLPEGLTGKKNVIAGIPRETGRFSVVISVTGNGTCSVPAETKAYSIRIQELIVRKVYFNFDSTALTTDAKLILRRLANRLDNGNSGVKIKIVGYVYPMLDLTYAKRIAQARAKAVERQLRLYGLEGNYVVSSKANSLPPLPSSRRVEIEVTYLGEQ